MDVSQIVKIIILAIVQCIVLIYYVQSQDIKIKERPFYYKIMIGIYISSVLFILIWKGRVDMPIYLAGGVIAAGLFDVPLGILTNIFSVFLAGFTGNIQVEEILYLLLLGTVLCLFAAVIKNLSTLGYGLVIILSLQMTLLFIYHNFLLADTFKVNTLYSLLSCLIIFFVSCLVFYLYKKGTSSYNTRDEIKGIKEEERLKEILDPGFPLLERLKKYSFVLYKHSLLISEIAGKAAKAAGADELTARAGGLYHQIGKIANKEYIEEGLKLAEEYDLPDCVEAVIRQHNLKYDKPKSPEAAIVMLTISIVSAKEYLKKSSELESNAGVPTKKIVDSIFQVRLVKGSMDESGLTLKQYNKLKEFFLQM